MFFELWFWFCLGASCRGMRVASWQAFLFRQRHKGGGSDAVMNGSNSQECTENIFPGWLNSYSQQFPSANAFSMSAVGAMTRGNNASNKDSAQANFLPCSCHVLLKLWISSRDSKIQVPSLTRKESVEWKIGHMVRKIIGEDRCIHRYSLVLASWPSQESFQNQVLKCTLFMN